MPAKPKPPSAFIQINVSSTKGSSFNYNPSAPVEEHRKVLRCAMGILSDLCWSTGVEFSLLTAIERKELAKALANYSAPSPLAPPPGGGEAPHG